jgi:hypothetical protein
VISTCYYAYNVFGRLQMQLRRTLITPAERELLAYDVPQTGALVFNIFPIFAILLFYNVFNNINYTLKASVIAAIILAFVVHEIQFLYEIDNYSTAIIINLFLWLGK